ncbi:hypothetical protein SAY86_011159 [Trapa natans]|uniref:Uncharacterized protein n=1 Tax=Trapa natans TaxID=22666 RepID=A0AAN7LY56_TRANT|nr:hypothetical protein SAY86_011159 [Trapa natans]
MSHRHQSFLCSTSQAGDLAEQHIRMIHSPVLVPACLQGGRATRDCCPRIMGPEEDDIYWPQWLKPMLTIPTRWRVKCTAWTVLGAPFVLYVSPTIRATALSR